jgi:hypothetical protein
MPGRGLPRVEVHQRGLAVPLRLRRASGLALLLFAASEAGAQSVRIDDAGRCSTEVRVVARDAPLRDVLERLSRALEFELRFESQSNPLLTVDVSRPPEALLRLLAGGENIAVSQAADRRCQGKRRMTRVWVLPAGTAHSPPAALPSSGAIPEEANTPARRGHGVR